jgi:hypothetical protein
VLGAAEVGELALERFHFRADYEGRVLANAVKGGKNFVPQLRVFRFQI